MFRVRYEDGGVDLSAAVGWLEMLSRRGTLTVLWATVDGNLILYLSTDQEHEALLVEGLYEALPGATLIRTNVGDPLSAFPRRLHLSGVFDGQRPLLPQLLLDLEGDAVVRAVWREGKTESLTIGAPYRGSAMRSFLAREWPSVRVLPVDVPLLRLEVTPSQLMDLPAVMNHLTLASRNVQELPFRRLHTRGMLLGSDLAGTAVRVPMPSRLVWVGSDERLDGVAGWMSRGWPRALILDATKRGGHQWYDGESNLSVSWQAPGRSTRLNPLARLPADTDAQYVDRAMEWFAGVGITSQVLGRLWDLLRVYVKLLSTQGELDPAQAMALLSHPQTALAPLVPEARELLDDQAWAVWIARDYQRDSALFAPAIGILRRIFTTSPQLRTLWFPPYHTAADLMDSDGWSVVQVPRTSPEQRCFWRGTMPLLTAMYNRPDSLTWGLCLGTSGRDVLRMASDGTPVVLWGRTMLDAVGTRGVPPCDVVLGAGADTGLSASLGSEKVLPAMVGALAADQAIARLGGDTGSIRFQLPRAECQEIADSSWLTSDGSMLPAVLGVLGDCEASAAVVAGLISASQDAGERVLVLIRDRSLLESLRSAGVDHHFVPMHDLPSLNPLEPRCLTRWAWWAQGLRLPRSVVQAGYEAEVRTVQELLHLVKRRADVPDFAAATSILLDVLQTEAIGVAETDPRTWFEADSVLVLETLHRGVTRALVMAGAVEIGARLVVWDAPGVHASDLQMLKRVRALVYPDRKQFADVLVARTTNGAAAMLPATMRCEVRHLMRGQVFVLRRETGTHYRVEVAV